jgi:hypothetical protein
VAFNFRPESSAEILAKKKKYDAEAALIFEVVMDKYGEGIILDPNTQFQKVKIPRVVADSATIAQVKQHLKSQGVDLKNIDVTFGDGSGAGVGTDAVETAKQENCTRLYCQHYMSNRKFPPHKEVLEIYPEVSDLWTETFQNQAKSIVGWIGSRGYTFSRDDGIMPFLEGIASTKCGVRTKDSWNPADIYAVKTTSERQIRQDLTKIGEMKGEDEARLNALNDYMRGKLANKELIGISLKKLSRGKVRVVELSNATPRDNEIDISIVPNSIMFDLDLNDSNEFKTGEMSFKLNVKGATVATQIRAFSGGKRESTQMDMTGKGEAAKLGKVSSTKAIGPYLRPLGLSRTMGTDLPRIGQWTEADIKKYVDQYNSIKRTRIGGQSIDWGDDDWESTLRKAIIIEQQNDRTASQLSAKLQCFRWVEIFAAIERQGKLKEFLVVLYYGAKKEYDSAGPFLKVA